MAIKAHVYFGAINLALNPTQRDTFFAALEDLHYPKKQKQPARRNHWRTRLDGEAVIFEALFLSDELTIPAFKQRLADIFSVDPATISHSTVNQNWGGETTPVVTFTRNGTDYVKVAVFAGVDASWGASGRGTRGYITVNQAEWEPDE